MDSLIDEALNTLMHSAIWRITWHLPLSTLIIVAVVVFGILAYRRSRRGASRYRYRSRRKSKWF